MKNKPITIHYFIPGQKWTNTEALILTTEELFNGPKAVNLC